MTNIFRVLLALDTLYIALLNCHYWNFCPCLSNTIPRQQIKPHFTSWQYSLKNHPACLGVQGCEKRIKGTRIRWFNVKYANISMIHSIWKGFGAKLPVCKQRWVTHARLHKRRFWVKDCPLNFLFSGCQKGVCYPQFKGILMYEIQILIIQKISYWISKKDFSIDRFSSK